jgi:hypothetical protein
VVAILAEWHAALKKFLAEHAGSLTEREKRACTLLQIHHSTAVMMLHPGGYGMGPQDPGPAHHSFEQILAWAKSIVATEDASNPATGMSMFTPDIGLVAPLFFVATNSPQADIQAGATALLEARPRVEGTWDSRVALRIINSLKQHEKSSDSPSAISQ